MSLERVFVGMVILTVLGMAMLYWPLGLFKKPIRLIVREQEDD